jgi:hypothetical protein
VINRNLKIYRSNLIDDGWHIVISGEPELDKLARKYDGMVNVKISRPSEQGTEEQNRAMHALLAEYYKTGVHSAPEGSTLADFKNYMKLQYGVVQEIEVNGEKYKLLKSWSEYDKMERTAFIDGLISEIEQSGASVEWKIQEILAGMQKENLCKK